MMSTFITARVQQGGYNTKRLGASKLVDLHDSRKFHVYFLVCVVNLD